MYPTMGHVSYHYSDCKIYIERCSSTQFHYSHPLVCIMNCQLLKSYKDDVAERHGYIRPIVDGVLTNDPDDVNLLRYFHSKGNQVKMMHKLIEHCLQTEELAARFLKVLRETNLYLYDDLKENKPRGKFGEYNHIYSETRPGMDHHALYN